MKEFKNHVETLAPEERRLHWHPTSSTIYGLLCFNDLLWIVDMDIGYGIPIINNDYLKVKYQYHIQYEKLRFFSSLLRFFASSLRFIPFFLIINYFFTPNPSANLLCYTSFSAACWLRSYSSTSQTPDVAQQS